MRAQYVTVYGNACQSPRNAIVRCHRSKKAAEKYSSRMAASIAKDGYSHGYAAYELAAIKVLSETEMGNDWVYPDVHIGEDLGGYKVYAKYDTYYDQWVPADY